MDIVGLTFLGLLSYIILDNQSNAVDQLAVPSLIAGVVAIIGAYVFGAAWDYHSFLSLSSRSSDKE